MALYYPSFDALRLADRLVDEIGRRTPACYRGRIGTAWHWLLPGGILVAMRLDYTVTEERWDVLRAQASTARAGVFGSVDFPFAAYATSATSPPFIHDLQGVAEWSNRLYFQMGNLIADAVRWLDMLHAAAMAPQVGPAMGYASLSPLDRSLVRFALEELDGRFNVRALHRVFGAQISLSRLSRLARAWQADGLLTEPPRRVTYGLRALAAEQAEAEPGEAGALP